jgi:hypothetical protein
LIGALTREEDVKATLFAAPGQLCCSSECSHLLRGIVTVSGCNCSASANRVSVHLHFFVGVALRNDCKLK